MMVTMSSSRPATTTTTKSKASIAALCTLGLVGAGTLFTGTTTTACAAPPDRSRSTEILTPDYPIYRDNVDVYLQRRCGTLDCHGQPGRAYRLYGFAGFRLYNLDAGLVSGQQPTVEPEVRANYQALVALEPEEMTRVMARQGQNPETLIMLRKPLKIERHKGGPAMASDDAGYKCVTAWLRIRTVRPTPDGLDFETIPQQEREAFSPTSKKDCAEAASNP
jgi:hypothetical protein